MNTVGTTSKYLCKIDVNYWKINAHKSQLPKRLCVFIRFIVGRKIDRKCPYRKRTGSARANFKVLVTKLD